MWSKKAMPSNLATQQKLTPMMEQYLSIRRTLSEDTVLFFRLGDFYEMFFDDAERAADILNITLTGRAGSAAGRIPMCGVPYHAFQGYVKKLIDHRLKVAICEQVGDPKTKGLVERRVTRIISAATYLDNPEVQKSSDYMVSICPSATDKDMFAIAALDLSTGEFKVRELSADRLMSDLSSIDPKEIILPHGLKTDQELLRDIKESLNVSLTEYEDWVFSVEEATKRLQDCFQHVRLETFNEQPHALIACGALLYYLRDHFHQELGHLHVPRMEEAHQSMRLDQQTQRSLELVRSLNGEKNGPNLLKCIDQTLTAMGARTLHDWVMHPLLNVAAIYQRQEAVAELINQSMTLHQIRELLAGVKDMERTLSRLNYGVANARDLINLKSFLERVPRISEHIASCQASLFSALGQDIRDFPEIKKAIQKTIVDEPPVATKDGGLIHDGFSEDLDTLRGLSKKGKDWLLEFERREAIRTGIKKLKIKYSRVFGYMLEVSQGQLAHVPDDYIRRQTLANAERFIVPELKSWDEKISGAQDKIKALEYELFDQLRTRVLEDLSPLQKMAQAIGVFDVLASIALTAIQKNWVRPTINEGYTLSIQEGRHPVVEEMLASREFIENDTLMNEKDHQLLLITGPNMAGKSTYIRQVALIVILGQIGSFVPAQKAEIGIVDRIFTRIGASDDLAKGESTFMVEMVEMAQILHQCTSKSLLVLDEVGRGTSTFDGVSIAWAICEHLSQGVERPRTLFATHYHELTQLEEHFQGIQNLHITVRETEDDIVFLRKVIPGGSDRSYGIHVARLAGIPGKVTQRANEILAVLEKENDQASQVLEDVPAAAQPDLFSFAQEPHPLVEEIKKMNLSEMTPLEALNYLAKWQKEIKNT
jgi:DNA mismatch repair protein MutS